MRASQPYIQSLRIVMVVVLCAVLAFIVLDTWRWPLTWDAQVLHYINFLIDHGFRPYRDITDMNMPGAYVIDSWQMHLMGRGDLAWRLYDFTLVGILTASLIVIALPYDWIAGLFAGVTFAVVHGMDGPNNLAQRDEIMAVLIVFGYAFLFEALRRRRWPLMIPFGFLLAMACAVKPTVVPLAVVLLVLAGASLKRRGEPIAAPMLGGVAGAAIAAAIVFGYLIHYQATAAFLDITRTLTPYYMGLANPSLVSLLPTMVQRGVALMVPLALAVAWFNREWIAWERWLLLLGFAFGVCTYLVQRKGFVYHRYTLTPFLLVWMGIEFMLAMKKSGWIQKVAIAAMVLGAVIVPPWDARRMLSIKPADPYTAALEADLTQLGGSRLQRKVQCLDLVDGCLNALYHLELVQSTGSTGDLLLFATHHTPTQEHYRQVFMDELAAHPASVIVLSNEWFSGPYTFDKIDQWPEFAVYLNRNYTPILTRQFPLRNGEVNVGEAYRIYVRRGEPFPRVS
jgi:hypothetical protein